MSPTDGLVLEGQRLGRSTDQLWLKVRQREGRASVRAFDHMQESQGIHTSAPSGMSALVEPMLPASALHAYDLDHGTQVHRQDRH